MNAEVMPMYELKVAAVLIPMSYGALRTFLYRQAAHYLPRYVVREGTPRKVRILSAAELHSIRGEVLRGQDSVVKPYVPLTAPGHSIDDDEIEQSSTSEGMGLKRKYKKTERES